MAKRKPITTKRAARSAKSRTSSSTTRAQLRSGVSRSSTTKKRIKKTAPPTKTKIQKSVKRVTHSTKPKRSTKVIKVTHSSGVIFDHTRSWFKHAQETLTQQLPVMQSRLQHTATETQHSLQAGVKQVQTQVRTAQVTVSSTAHQLQDQVSAATKSLTHSLSQTTQNLNQALQRLKPQPSPKKKKVTKKKSLAKIVKKKKTKVVKVFDRSQRSTLQFIQHEIIGSFVYIFRYHPFMTFGSILLSLIILGSSYAVYDVVFKDLPSVTEITERKQILTTQILDRNGKLLYEIYKDQNRTLIPLTRVPKYMIEATISIEDRDFYNHKGVSFKGILRAFTTDLKGERVEGGSTITQQLVKNTLLTPERTFKRKIREVLLAFIMEGTYTKDEILGMYFNEVSYGGSTYGVEQAAQRYFGKPAEQLSLAECAFLAGLPAAPSVYSPFGDNPQYAYDRQHEVLRRMVEDHYITQQQADEAKKEVLHFKEDKTDIKAPHFVMYVRSLLEKQYGEDVLDQGGLIVRTSLDLDAQNSTQQIVTSEVNNLARLHITNGAAVITNPKTGEILAMVGSKDYFDFAHDGQVNVTMSPRQPGSSIKPLTYAIAFEHGETPSTTILDEPTTFSIPGAPPYSPKNYDGRFHGNVTIREALGSSYNIPAVKTLASIGVNTMIDKAEEMGITTWKDRQRFGLSLTLGGGEVYMTEEAQIYGTFATYGDTIKLNPILEVRDSKGNVLYHNSCALDHTDCPSTHTIDSKVAYEITDILKDNNARTPAFGPHSVLVIPGQEVAVKTGTTNNLKDNWAFGYTTDRVVGVWVGNNDGSPMSYVASGITGASPIWNKIMRTQLNDDHPNVFPVPDGLVKVNVCVPTGTLPCRGCPVVREDLFVPGTEPTVACNPAVFAPKPSPSPGAVDQILNGVTVH